MNKEEVYRTLFETKVVAVIRVDNSANLLEAATALHKGGVRALEITMTSPGALDAIKEANEKLDDDVVIGVGSVLDPETARAAIIAGVKFVVSPVLNLDIIRMCQRYSITCIPGAFTPTEILRAWEAGADFVKIFPATRLGPSFIKDIKGPMPQVKLTPTGGVNLDNAAEFIKAGASFVGAGGSLVKKQLIADKKWDQLTALAAQFIEKVKS
ncbi:MAG TPA: bifunctional 4-hydroxy-2-oxoglutarate aldolase/2-dehydro-3-deoxy-phosphogluconate aldolase [Firmicutes bacterium]|jgi:2-dehydro-3-deoxyphosphogluconate aldolase/(4S)-4-hydroxy-2-oxoglutarate aldolase|nr:bifunctional 4-hydroxy-2-oxoglutarate aldolase/2-dehydro-3-deoxy-phosphogluconate aldolase [Bacillota bacterium]